MTGDKSLFHRPSGYLHSPTTGPTKVLSKSTSKAGDFLLEIFSSIIDETFKLIFMSINVLLSSA